MEIGADVILKATRVEGVYDKDPLKFKNAKKFGRLSYIDVLNKNLRFMDAAAVSLCMDNKLPIVIFNLTKKGNIKRAVLGQNIGTVIR
jgi:uridylate kinase